ncbi:MAG: hypothetical protein IIU41_00465 [Oscillospiraceae bacterium]|nr:hypothetical protein [Oscillospiraceae bacterium]
MDGVYRFAELNIAVRSLFRDVHDYCAEFHTDAEADFAVETSAEDIAFERTRAAASDAALGRPSRAYTDGYLEELAVYRKIAERLPLYDTVLFHGSALAADGEGYLFTAPSGTGKSTHARLWRELLGDRVVMINDDKPLLRVTEEGVTVYGTPFRGKHGLGGDVSAPLRSIGLLSRGEENDVRTITASDAFPRLLRQAYRPSDGPALKATLAILERLARTVRFFDMKCNTDVSAAAAAFGAMSKG